MYVFPVRELRRIQKNGEDHWVGFSCFLVDLGTLKSWLLLGHMLSHKFDDSIFNCLQFAVGVTVFVLVPMKGGFGEMHRNVQEQRIF